MERSVGTVKHVARNQNVEFTQCLKRDENPFLHTLDWNLCHSP